MHQRRVSSFDAAGNASSPVIQGVEFGFSADSPSSALASPDASAAAAHHSSDEQHSHFCHEELENMKKNPFWTPRAFVLCSTLLAFCCYADRGIAPAVDKIMVDKEITGGDNALTSREAGYIMSAFVLTFTVASPVAAAAPFPSNNIILFGIAAMAAASLLAATSHSYAALVLARGITGIAEASYIAFLPPIIDSVSPPNERGRNVGLVMSMTVFGVSVGIVANSVLCSLFSWRAVFIVTFFNFVALFALFWNLPKEFNFRRQDRGEVAIAAAASAFSSLRQKQQTPQSPVAMKPGSPVAAVTGTALVTVPTKSSNDPIPVCAGMVALLSSPHWMAAVLGSAAFTAVFGALSFFAVSAMVQRFDVSLVAASVFLGVSAGICGLAGALSGAYLLDHMPGGGATVLNSTKIMTVAISLTIPLGYVALSASTFPLFACALVPALAISFSYTAPMNSLLLNERLVDPRLKALSLAMCVVVIHIADIASPAITGSLSDSFNKRCSTFANNASLCASHHAYHDDSSGDRGSNEDGMACLFFNGTERQASRCVNPEGLMIALKIIWTLLIIAVPMWGGLWWSFHKRKSGAVAGTAGGISPAGSAGAVTSATVI